MRCIPAALTVAMAVFTATWLAVCGNHAAPQLQSMADEEGNMDQLARAMDGSSVVRRSACGGSLSGSGTLTSPGYPSNYMNNLDCEWVITAPVGEHVQLTVSDMIIENQSGCAWDKLFIKVAGEMVPSVLCGSGSVAGSFISGGNEMTVVFRSDSSVTEKGFEATYTSLSM